MGPKDQRQRRTALVVLIVLIWSAPAFAQYTRRFNTIDNGAVTFTGNALGLDAETSQNGQGTRGAIGTFITINPTLRDTSPSPTTAPLFPLGTTSDWRQNSSQAVLRLPQGARVLHAELVWGGTFAGNTAADNVSAFINNAVSFTTPLGTFDVAPDPATAKSDGNPAGTGTCNGCFYVRTANVTALVSAAGAGVYTTGRVPATQGTTDNNNPVAGWTLAVVYEDFNQPIRNLALFLGLEESGGAAASVSGFCTPPSGPVSGRLAVTAMEGDARITGDKMLFGQKAPLSSADSVQGPRNPLNNFFSGQIVGDDGTLDTSGTFGDRNHTPDAPSIGARQGWDITNVNVSDRLKNNQTTAVAQGTTSGDAYHLMALALQIDVGAPQFQSDGAMSVDKTIAAVGDILTYTVLVNNSTGTTNANNVIFSDTMGVGTSYVAGSFTLNGVAQPGANPTIGVPLGTIAAGTTATIRFQARVDSIVPTDLRINRARWTFDFVSCAGQPAQSGATEAMAVTQVPVADLEVTKSLLSVSPATAGALVRYVVAVVNNGPSSVVGALVTDNGAVPPVASQAWVCRAVRTASCPASGTGPLNALVNMDPGGFVTFFVTGTLPANTAPGTLTNTATVSVPASVPDFNLANNTATVSVPIARSANLSVTAAGPASGTRGSNVTYTITVRNNGPSDVDNVVVTNPTPTGLTLVSGVSGPCASAPGCRIASGGTQTLSVTFAIPPAYAGPDPIIDTATAADSAVSDPQSGNNTGTAQTSLDAPVVDLTLTKTDGVTVVTAGLTTTYTITVTNAGPASALGSRVVDQFDPAMFSNIQWQCVASGTSSCTVSGPQSGNIDTLINVDPGAGNAVVFTAQAVVLSTLPGTGGTPPGSVATPGLVINSATVTAAAGFGEANHSDNTATDTDSVRVVADMSIVKTGPATIVPGSTVDYTVVVSNAGPSAVHDFVFVDTPLEGSDLTGLPRPELVESVQAPADSSCTTTSEFPGFPSLPECTIPLIEAGGSRVFTVRLTIPADFQVSAGPSALSNVADALTGGFDEDPDVDDLTSITSATVTRQADVVLRKTGPAVVVAGDVASYFVDVSNGGPSIATNVVANDTLPAGVTVSGGSGPCLSAFSAGTPCTIGTLAPGIHATTRIDLLVPADYSGPPTLLNSATATGDDDPVSTNNAASVSTLVVPDHADVGVTLTAPASVPRGGTLTVSAHVTNFGPGPAFNVTLSASIPGGSIVVGRNIPPGITCTTPTPGVTNLSTCLIPVMQPGESLDFSRTLQIEPSVVAGSVLTDLVTVWSTTPGHNPNNNQAVTTIRVTDAIEAGVSIEKTDSPDPVVTGSNVTYTLTARNRGPAAATNITVVDTLPAGMSLVSSTPSQGSCAGATCSLGTIAANGLATVTIVAATSAVGLFTNTATVSAAEPDPVLTNNTVSETTTVANPDQADLLIEKIGPTVEAPGRTSFYTITVTNRGPGVALNVQVLDTLPAGMTFLGNSGACTTPFPCDFEALEPGQSLVIFTAFTVDSGIATPTTVVNTATVSSTVTVDPDPINNSSVVSTDIDAAENADLQVTKVDSPDAVLAGTTLSYAVSVINRGPAVAPNVVMTDVLPPGLTLISATHAGGACSGTMTLTCNLGTMTPATSVLVGILARVSPGAMSLSNTASATSDAPDPNLSNNSATEPTAVLPPIADLSVVKVLTTPAIPGLTATYRIVVMNNGPSAVIGAGVTDAFPGVLTGMTWTCVAPTGSACGAASGAGAIATTVDLLAGQAATFMATGTIASSALGVLTNTATVAPPAGTTDPNPSNNTSVTSDTLAPQADLQVSKSGPAQGTPGASITYTITVTNAGPSDALAVTLSDPTPAGLTFVSGGGACAAYPCSLGTVAAGATIAATATFAVPPGYTTPDPIVNTATVSSGTTPDPAAGNNTATAMTAIAAPVTDLGITKTNGVTVVVPGSSTTYTITVTNAGPSNAVGATVTDVFPAALTGVTWTCIGAGGGTCVASGSGTINTTVSIPVGGSVIFTATGAVALEAVGVLVNTATVTPGPGASDPSSANNTDADTITPQADVAITKTGPASIVAGSPLVYTITVTDNGPSNAETVVVSDITPTGLTFQSNAGGCTTAFPCALGTLPAGETRTITSTFLLPPDYTTPAPIVNTADVSSTTTDPDAANNSATAQTPLNRDADIEVTKSVAPAAVLVGGTVTVTVSAHNIGPNAATGVEVTDTLPAGLQFVSATSTTGTYDETTGKWTVGVVGVNATAQLTITARVTSIGSITNLAVKTGQNEPDPNTANDSAGATTNAAASADVLLEKTVDHTEPLVGEMVTFTVRATNRGPSAANGVTVTDPLPPGLSLTNATASQGSYDTTTGIWNVGSLAPSTAATLTLSATVDQPGVLVNNAATVSQAEADPNPLNNSAAASINGLANADLRVTKAISNATPPAGTNVTYTIAVTNLGPSPATSATILDLLPAGLSFVSATPSQGTYDAVTGIWTLGGVPATVTETLSITAHVNQPGNVANTAARQTSTPVDPNPANDGASVTAAASVVADLAVTKTSNTAVASAGGPLTWTIVVTNQGPSPVTAASVTDAFPTALTTIQWTCTPGSGAACATSSGTGALTTTVDLPAGSATTFIVTGIIDPAATGVIDSVVTVGAPGGTTDPDLTNNTASAPVSLTSNADVRITGTGPGARVVPGRTATYTFTVANSGPGPADTVVLADPTPTGTTFVSASGACGGGFPCSLGTLAVGATVTITATFRVLPPTMPHSTITNIATVTAATGDPSPANNTATFVASVGRRGCDVNGDGIDEIVTGAGPGGGPHVRVFTTAGGTLTELASFYAFDPSFTGGVTVACGDIDGDGFADIVAGAGPGDPLVRAFSLAGGLHEIANFFAYNPAFRGGVDVAVGDVTGDGIADIITGAGPGGGPHVRAFSFDGGALTVVASFYAYDPAFPGGVHVAAGDTDGDGVDEIITGAGPSGSPHVRVLRLDGGTLTEAASFYAYDSGFPGGVHVAAGDTDGDGIDELITGAGPSGGPHVRVFQLSGATLGVTASFYAYDPAFTGGVWVGAADIDGDGTLEIVTGAGPSGAPHVRVLHLNAGTLTEVVGFFAYDPGFPGGVTVASAAPLRERLLERPPAPERSSVFSDAPLTRTESQSRLYRFTPASAELRTTTARLRAVGRSVRGRDRPRARDPSTADRAPPPCSKHPLSVVTKRRHPLLNAEL